MFIQKPLCIVAAAAAAIIVASCGGGATKSSGAEPNGGGGRPQSQRQAQRQSQAQAKSEAAAVKEHRAAAKDIGKLRNARMNLLGLNIPCGIGEGSGASEAEALGAATEQARAAAAASVEHQVQGFANTYAHNVAAGPRKAWADHVTRAATAAVSQAPVYKSITVRDRAQGTFTVTALVILDPDVFNKALAAATQANREFQQRAQHANMMRKMEAVIKDFNSKYRKEK